jgi:predicted nucleotidyltransferase
MAKQRQPHGTPMTLDMRDEWRAALRQWASNNDCVRELWLFGSWATGDATPGSDVDVALVLTPPKGADNWALGKYLALGDDWSTQLEKIVGCHVSLEAIVPGSEPYAMVRKTGALLWSRDNPL